jgi:hypothetical protein
LRAGGIRHYWLVLPLVRQQLHALLVPRKNAASASIGHTVALPVFAARTPKVIKSSKANHRVTGQWGGDPPIKQSVKLLASER